MTPKFVPIPADLLFPGGDWNPDKVNILYIEPMPTNANTSSKNAETLDKESDQILVDWYPDDNTHTKTP